jgi:hypothetical protein
MRRGQNSGQGPAATGQLSQGFAYLQPHYPGPAGLARPRVKSVRIAMAAPTAAPLSFAGYPSQYS